MMKKSRTEKKNVERETTILITSEEWVSSRNICHPYDVRASYQGWLSRNDKFYERPEMPDSKLFIENDDRNRRFFYLSNAGLMLTGNNLTVVNNRFWKLVSISVSNILTFDRNFHSQPLAVAPCVCFVARNVKIRPKIFFKGFNDSPDVDFCIFV